MIELEAVTLMRGGRKLIDSINLKFMRGRVTAILGPNGAGKSTVVKVISGEWPSSGGKVRFCGTDLRRVAPSTLAGQRAVVPQSTVLSFPFDVLGVVMLGTTVPGFGITSDQTHAHKALDDVGLTGFQTRKYTTLSGGERQRVHIARALCQLNASPTTSDDPKALILDEPTASLDPAHQSIVLEVLQQQAALGRIVAVVLHDLNLAAAWADEIVIMAGGRIEATGTPAQVMTDKVLSAAYNCEMRVNEVPTNGSVFVLPHHTRGGKRADGVRPEAIAAIGIG